MTEEDKDKYQSAANLSVPEQPGQQQQPQPQADHRPLAETLGIEDIYDPMVGHDGKVFCTAGRDAPIAEFDGDFLILHPPQMPLDESSAGEDFSLHCDARGIVLDELGVAKKVPAATIKGCPIFFVGEQKPGTLKHFVAAITPDGSLHAIYFRNGARLTSQDVYDLRNRSADGEISTFEDVVCDI